MKTITTQLAAHIAGEVTTLATCWKLTRRDTTVFGFTDHDQDIAFSGVTYKAATGFTPSAIQTSGSLAVDNLDVDGMLSSGSITEADILAGLYDFAEIEIFQVNYIDLTQGALKLRRGWLGEVSLYKQEFVAEVRGLTQRLSQTIGELYSASCRATLGDSRCKVDMTTNTVTGSVTTAVSILQFTDSTRSEASDTFGFGTLTFTGGANNGLSMEVKEYIYTSGIGGQITLALPVPYTIAVGDTYSLTKGCDKTLATCFSRFNNVVNFRGEPLVPGLDKMLETAGTRSQ
ncbi:MAG: DUF2163 domain-containing protein [Pseudomonadota bacterium]|nr:DUF2163 domain-containing protein [Pseudomonadota bacterium]MDE3037128.1 DUF2163 domain-containing protein [Pseudomonadota bacterium]